MIEESLEAVADDEAVKKECEQKIDPEPLPPCIQFVNLFLQAAVRGDY
jgi:hypothetical protein